jgi:O-antigen ligase
LYTLFVAGCARDWVLTRLLQIIVIATTLGALYTFLFVFTSAGWLPSWMYIDLVQGQAVSFYSGYMEMHLYFLSTLNFAVPFLVGLVLESNPQRRLFPRWFLWMALALGFAAVAMSGRRAIWLVTAISPFVALGFRVFIPGSRIASLWKIPLRLSFMLVVAALVFNVAYDFDLNRLFEYFSRAFRNSSDAELRQMIFYRLRDGWLESPLIGFGIGAGLSDFVRSVNQPWAYELSYMALLYQTGLLGILLYTGGVAWIYGTGIRVVRSGHRLGEYVIPVLTGTTSFLIANGTNPYLAKYDYLWVVFLPVAIVNLWLVEKDRQTNDRGSAKARAAAATGRQ